MAIPSITAMLQGVVQCEMLNEHGITPLWIYYDSYSAKYWVEEMEQLGAKTE